MIKIDKINIEQISTDYADYVLSVRRRPDKKNRFIVYVFDDARFRDLLLCPAESLQSEIEKFNAQFPLNFHAGREWDAFKIYMINQYSNIRNSYLHKVLNALNLSVCPYCNRQYIYSIDDGKQVSAQFDHFYSKSEHPYLALSFYNLIPCCPTCNKAKGENKIEINPYMESFGTKGKIVIDNPLNCILNDNNWDITIQADDRCNTNVKAFVLDKLYQKHKDYAHEIVFKAIANQQGYIDGLRTEFQHMNLPAGLIERILWGNYINEESQSERPLSKMTADIIAQINGKSNDH